MVRGVIPGHNDSWFAVLNTIFTAQTLQQMVRGIIPGHNDSWFAVLNTIFTAQTFTAVV
jgi:hypothetical protein